MNVSEIRCNLQDDLRVFIFLSQVVIIDEQPDIVTVCIIDKPKTSADLLRTQLGVICGQEHLLLKYPESDP